MIQITCYEYFESERSRIIIAVAGNVLRKQKGILVWAWPFYGFVLCRGPTKKKTRDTIWQIFRRPIFVALFQKSSKNLSFFSSNPQHRKKSYSRPAFGLDPPHRDRGFAGILPQKMDSRIHIQWRGSTFLRWIASFVSSTFRHLHRAISTFRFASVGIKML